MNAFYRFMSRRYGADLLSWCLLVLSFALTLIFGLFDLWFLCLLPLIPALFALYRTLSTDIKARRRENKWITQFGSNMKLAKNKFRDRKTHIYFRCACCDSVLRIPRGKGVLKVTCPRCKSVSEKDTGSTGVSH